MAFKDLLREYLAQHSSIPAALFEFLPSGFQQLESKVILKLNQKLENYSVEIANTIPIILPGITAVWLRTGEIEGKFRQPQGLIHVWGEPTTEIILTENNVRYKFDFTKIMFAKGNITERGLLPKKVQPGEIIVDMFAGIGYFTLGMAKSKKPQKIYAVEWNPDSYKYLCENIKLNHIEDIVDPFYGDCKEIVPDLAKKGIRADRVIMGLLPAPKECIPHALTVVKDTGTTVLYEGVEPKESSLLFDEFTTIAEMEGFSTELLERRVVKNYKPHQYHTVVEIFVKRENSGSK
jgi:tRNA wybutosine-synthesizing protein 2